MLFRPLSEMVTPNESPPTVLCLASYFKGGAFLEACKEAGGRVILLTREKLKFEHWPFASIDEFHLMPDLSRQPDVTHGAAYLARSRGIDAVVALDEYDALTAADLREHFRLPGLGHTRARYFRDKLAMRTRAKQSRIRVPRFVRVVDHSEVADFIETVPPPWMMKPRMEASAMGIKRCETADDVWQHIEQLGDLQSHFLLEQFVEGVVFHVDSIVTAKKVVAAVPSRYESPPLNVYQQGGVFQTTTVDPESDRYSELVKVNMRLLRAFGLDEGVAHAEFILGDDDKLYFLEVAARVGGAGIDKLVEAAVGVNLWAEWARLVTLPLRGESYQLPHLRSDHAGLLACLSRDEAPDMSLFQDDEVYWVLEKPHHAGLALRSESRQRLFRLLADYRQRFARQFLATEPPLEKAPD